MTTSVGFVTANISPGYRVRVNGEDVTSRCFAADDVEGYADCFKLNADGMKYCVEGTDGQPTAAIERLFGVVEIERAR